MPTVCEAENLTKNSADQFPNPTFDVNYCNDSVRVSSCARVSCKPGLDVTPRQIRDGKIHIGNMLMDCNHSGVCVLASTVKLETGFYDVVAYVTNDSGAHWNGPELLYIAPTKAVNILDLSCNQIGDECYILIQSGYFEPTYVYQTDDFGLSWFIKFRS